MGSSMSQLVGQTILRGKVMDGSTGESLIGATLEVKGTNHGGVTDFNGDFYLKLDSIPPVSLTIAYGGYETLLIVITDASLEIVANP